MLYLIILVINVLCAIVNEYSALISKNDDDIKSNKLGGFGGLASNLPLTPAQVMAKVAAINAGVFGV